MAAAMVCKDYQMKIINERDFICIGIGFNNSKIKTSTIPLVILAVKPSHLDV
jgi:hypothetical protein